MTSAPVCASSWWFAGSASPSRLTESLVPCVSLLVSQKGSLRVHDQVQEQFALDVFGWKAWRKSSLFPARLLISYMQCNVIAVFANMSSSIGHSFACFHKHKCASWAGSYRRGSRSKFESWPVRKENAWHKFCFYHFRFHIMAWKVVWWMCRISLPRHQPRSKQPGDWRFKSLTVNHTYTGAAELSCDTQGISVWALQVMLFTSAVVCRARKNVQSLSYKWSSSKAVWCSCAQNKYFRSLQFNGTIM
jgi:hypothetical protein